MKKNVLFNTVMVLLIVLVAAGGIMFVGNTKGWFGEDESLSVTAINVVGSVEVQRNGVAFALEKDAVLREGDIIGVNENAKAVIAAGSDTFTFGGNSEVSVGIGEDGFAFTVNKGEVFAVINDGKIFDRAVIGSHDLTSDKAVCFMSAQTGSYLVNVFEGGIILKNEAVEAGNSVSASDTFFDVTALKADSLSDFEIKETRELSGKELCFTDEELQQVLDDREEERLLALAEKEDADSATVNTNKEKPSKNTDKTDKNASQSANAGKNESDKNTEENTDDKNTTTVNPPVDTGKENADTTTPDTDQTMPEVNTPVEEPTPEPEPEPEPEPSMVSCTIKITCSSILDNMDKLEAGKDAYVPSNGVILSTKTFEVEEGTCVFDVLKKACNKYGIQLEYSWTPGYNSNYVEGINHIYEFDCGETSGWKYKVNGWYPNYGSSQYEIEDGDTIVWVYTCDL